MKCVIYIRVSGKGQTDGDGPRRQQEACSHFCDFHGAVNMGEFYETISGTVEGLSRPVFCEMLDAVENFRINGVEIEGIIVERIDRLARDLLVSEILLQECRKRRIKVFASDRGLIDLSENDGDPTRKLMRQITSALAEWEKNSTVLKLRKARQAIKARTGRCEGAKPYGQNTVEQCVLKTLKVFVQPDHTLKQVADMLNSYGFKTRAGFDFNVMSAMRVMQAAGVWTRKDPAGYRLKNLGDKRKVGNETIGQLKGQ